MKRVLKPLLIAMAKALRPLVCGRSLKRMALRIGAFILFPDRKLTLYGWPTLLNIGNIEIGSHCSINPGVLIQGRNKVVLGNHVTLSAHVLILDAGLVPDDVLKGAPSKDHSSAPVIIEDHVWVGAGAIILPGVRIGQRSIVGAGAVVTADVPPGSVVAGVPARVIRRFQPEIKPAQTAPRTDADAKNHPPIWVEKL